MPYKVTVEVESTGTRYTKEFASPPFIPAVGDTIWVCPDEQEEARLYYSSEKRESSTDFGHCVVKERWFDFCSDASLQEILIIVTSKAV